MPIWLRKFTFHQIKEFYQKEAEAHNKATKKTANSSTDMIDLINPDKSKLPQNFNR